MADQAPPSRTVRDPESGLGAAFDAWVTEPLGRHLTAVLLLVLLLAARYAPIVLAPEPINDEMIYVAAFEATTRDQSPFSRSGYLTLSLLAYLGGWCLERLGELPTLALLRLANLAGVATTAWCALAWTGWPWSRRLLVAAIYLLLAPAVWFGVFVGNLSLAVSGMIVVGLLIWPRRPLLAGLLLGGSVVAKPVAPGAVVALLFHRSAGGGRRQLLAGGVAAAVTLAVVLGSPHLGQALAIDAFPRLDRTVSPHRLLQLLDLRVSAVGFSALIALGVAWAAWRRPLGLAALVGLATTAAIATTPLVWPHTLLVTLPLQVLCLELAWRRYRSTATPDGWRGTRPRLELLAVGLAVVTLQLSEGATNIYDQAMWIQWLGSLPQMLAPAALTAYLWRHSGRRAGSGARESPGSTG